MTHYINIGTRLHFLDPTELVQKIYEIAIKPKKKAQTDQKYLNLEILLLLSYVAGDWIRQFGFEVEEMRQIARD